MKYSTVVSSDGYTLAIPAVYVGSYFEWALLHYWEARTLIQIPGSFFPRR